MVRSGFAFGCCALLCLGTGCPKDVEDPGFTASGAETTAASSSTGDVDPTDPTADGDTTTTGPEDTTTGETPETSSTSGTPGTTTTPATDTGAEESDTAPTSCGNGMVETGEQCDGADLQNFDCGSLGLGTGAVSCTAMCTFDTSMCMNMGSGTSG